MNKPSYEWEKGLKLGADFPDDVKVIGLAVMNVETGEGAIVCNESDPNGVLRADVWGDIQADVSYVYGDAVSNMLPEEGEGSEG